jgi:acyl transferase domain-containing protein/surfactin synthase thioesterase subunit
MESEKNGFLLKRSLEALKVLEEKLKRYENDQKEPVAIIGMACRFPGESTNPEKFWDLLREGRDGICVIPKKRWNINEFYSPNPDDKGKMYVKKAGFLKEDITEFDARFFGISPREAMELDPQQRLLLEVSWEALERAGVMNEQLKGSQTGVFIGIGGSEFSALTQSADQIGIYTGTGMATNIAAGRIAHTFGLHGPTMSIDTACSSSLVAVHLACNSLKLRESDTALTGGVNIMLTPDLFVILCKMNALSTDGSCKTFDAKADGYARAEGCGIVVLKRLSDALADGDPILAVIKGSAMNHDGQTSGLTVPNGLAQKKLIRKALDNARVSAAEISMVETHGTGTSLGDPIEVQALADIFGKKKRQANPLIIGTVKSNIGHLEAAAGIAGLIKTVLCLQNKEVPPNLHFTRLNPLIKLDQIPAIIPTEPVSYHSGNGPMIAGVSSFGFSGTNAHLIISEPPQRNESPEDVPAQMDRPAHIMAFSAKDKQALQALAMQYQKYLEEHSDHKLADFCYSLNAYRIHFPYRTSIIAHNSSAMIRELNDFTTGNQAELLRDTKKAEFPRIAFIFGGGLAKIKNAGKILYESQPAFKKEFDNCVGVCKSILNQNPLNYLFSQETADNSPAGQGIQQVTLFCLQYSMAQLLEGWGIIPAAALGENTGEFAGACVAGIMNLDTAIHIIGKNNGMIADGDIPGKLSSARLRFISSFSGEMITRDEIAVAYWQDQRVAPSLIQKGIEGLTRQGYRFLVAIGADTPFLADAVELDAAQEQYKLLAIKFENLWETLLQTVSEIYNYGIDINWSGFDAGYKRLKLVLPTYPFQRRRYWPETAGVDFNNPNVNLTTVQKIGESYNPLEPRLNQSPLPQQQFEYYFGVDTFPELKDNENVLHVGYYQEFFGGIMKYLHGDTSYIIKDMDWIQALYFEDSIQRTVFVIMEPEDEQSFSKFKIYSRGERQSIWLLHAQGKIRFNTEIPARRMAPAELKNIQRRCKKQCTASEFEHLIETQGFNLGPSVKCVDHAWYRTGEVLVKFRKQTDNERIRYYSIGVHPGIFDSCAQLFLLGGSKKLKSDDLYMVIKIENFFFKNLADTEELWCHLKVKDELSSEGHMRGEYFLFDQNGNHLAQVQQQAKILSKEHQLTLKSAFTERGNNSTLNENTALVAKLKKCPDEQGELLQNYLHETTAGLLRMALDEVEVNEPLRELGLDSLIGVELKNKIEKDLQINIALEYILQGPTIIQLSNTVKRICTGKTDDGNEVGWYSNQNYRMDIDYWTIHHQPNPRAKVRLFCIPYGVIGGSLFREWSKKLPDYIDVWPIQFPGKENRMNEKPIDNIREAVDALEEVFSPALDLPYAFYGHSIGALIAFRFAYRLWERHANKPVHLFPGGYVSPSIYPNPVYDKGMKGLHHFGFDGFPNYDMIANVPPEQWRKYHDFIGMEFGINMTEDLRRAIKPVAFSEFRICHTYKPEPDEKTFDLPITGFHGVKDTFCSEEEMAAWRELTTGPFKYHVLDGDHFFCHEDQALDELLRLIAEVLKAYL